MIKIFFKYLKNVFRPEFKPTEEDLLVIANNKVNNKSFSLEDENTIEEETANVFQENFNLDVLLAIYNETKLKTEKAYFNAVYINFKGLELNSYKELLETPSEEKVQFLYFLIKDMGKPLPKTTQISERFKAKLFQSVLATKLTLTSDNLNDFFVFGMSKDLFYLWNTTSTIVKKAKELSKKNSINSTLIKSFEKYIFRGIELYRYETFHRKIAQIHRVVIDYKYKEEGVPFLLIPDYFGKKINKILLSLNKDKAIALSKILQLLSLKTRNDTQNKQLEQAIDEFGLNSFLDTSINILILVSAFKTKMKIRLFWQPYLKKKLIIRDYFPIFNDNFMIAFGLVKLLEEKKLIHKVPLKTLGIITKRSYTLKKEYRLSKGSTKLGDLCVNILANHYGNKGITELKEIYDEIPYKKVRKIIGAILKEDL